MKKVVANSKAKHLVAGQEYLVTEEIALLLEEKGWVGDEPAPTPTPKPTQKRRK